MKLTLINPFIFGGSPGSSNDQPHISTSDKVSKLSASTSSIDAEKSAVATQVDNINSDISDVNQNPSDKRAEAQLMADLAALHDAEKKLFTDAGDSKEASKFAKNATFTEEGSFDDILKTAGAKDKKSKDYSVASSTDSSGNITETASIGGSSASVQLQPDLQTQYVIP